MENLLAFIEFTQFQQYLKGEMNAENNDADVDPIKFANNIPTSLILEEKEDANDDILYDAKVKAYRIYGKYVAVGSEFEINVSYESRNKARKVLYDLDSLLKKKRVTANVLFKVFEDCRQEIWMLLIGSYGRFQRQPEFKEFDPVNLIELPGVEIHFSRSESVQTNTPTNV